MRADFALTLLERNKSLIDLKAGGYRRFFSGDFQVLLCDVDGEGNLGFVFNTNADDKEDADRNALFHSARHMFVAVRNHREGGKIVSLWIGGENFLPDVEVDAEAEWAELTAQFPKMKQMAARLGF